ncbi:putative cytochrome P450 monooxygenase [Aspergillus lucknowensis]|uniref:Cytochrome P450 n=1 Tax=Aspergillus lucknowensis TaxID=176173 RepID=A0ABR4LYQ5_9EURO
MAACAIALVLALVAGALHLFFSYSRLKLVPGPFLAAVSNLWRMNAQRSFEDGQHLTELHEKYGDVVRLAPNHVSIRSIRDIASVYTRKLAEELGSPSQDVSQGQLPGRREVVGQGDIDEALWNIIGTIERHTTIELTGLLRFFAEEFTSRLLIDGSAHLQTSSVPEAQACSSLFATLEEQLLRGPVSILKRERLSFSRLGRDTSHPENHGSDHTVSGAEDAPGEGVRDKSSVQVAGIEIMVRTFVASFYFILHNPRVLSGVRREIDNAPRFWDRYTHPYWRDLVGLYYFDAVLNETMRHVILNGQPEIQLITGALDISSMHIPRGTTVLWHPHVVLGRPSIYGEAVAQFRPARWFVFDRQRRELMKEGLLPFNVCIERCPEFQAVWLELKKAVIALFREFDVSLSV